MKSENIRIKIEEKKQTIKVFILLIVGIFFAIFLSLAVFVYVAPSDCTPPSYSKKYYSPDRKYYAQGRYIGCGGAAGSVTNDVALFRTEDTNNDSDYKKNIVFTDFHGGVQFNWLNNKKLEISDSDCSKGKTERENWNDVDIIFDKYEQTCPEIDYMYR